MTSATVIGLGRLGEESILRQWVRTVLLGESVDQVPVPAGLEVLRNDVGTLAFNRSNWGKPLQIGGTSYEHGLGTHCVSEIVVRLEEPGERFEAQIGMDDHPEIPGPRGAVWFTVEVAGDEAFRSNECRAGDEPIPVNVDLRGARDFTLRVLDADPGQNHADWANAAVTLQSGKRIRLDEMSLVNRATFGTDLPFSFTYGGEPFAQLISSWKRTVTPQRSEDGKERYLVTYVDPDTGLEVVSDIALFAGSPAVEWVVHMRNTGSVDSPILENVRALDLDIRTPVLGNVILHQINGSSCTENDFLPIDEPVEPGAEIVHAAVGGRSSGGVVESAGSSTGRMPFFNLEWGGGGLVGAIGWSGQWEMRLVRRAKRKSPLQDKFQLTPDELVELRAHMEREFARQADRELNLQAGQQTTRFRLHPGESVRTPRILLLIWEGDDPWRGYNLFRRLLLNHYVPRLGGEIVMPPVAQCAFPGGDLNAAAEGNQLQAIERMASIGTEAYWLDAGWFEGGWPNGVGSWVPDKEKFPRGLKPLGDAARDRGLDFVVWFEPERVNHASRIAKEHPEWVLHAGDGDGLFNLGEPAARAWLTDHISQCISDWGVTIYRHDCNIDPLPFWQAADMSNRQGITEIRYIEGLYAFWDELRRRHPQLLIDNCCSGGRRIDLETTSRSIPLWRSDTQCSGKAHPTWDQAQTAGLSLFVPLHTAGVWAFDPYTYRSVATMGLVVCPDIGGDTFPAGSARRAIDEIRMLRPLWLGDYYPLAEIDVHERHWCGWQFHRADLGRGFLMLFRRPQSPYASLQLQSLRGLDSSADYEVTFVDDKEKRVMKGGALQQLRVEIDEPGSSVLLLYQKMRSEAKGQRAESGSPAGF